MVLTWVYSGGTIALAADFRAVTWTPTIAYVDASAGADTQTARLTALKDATASIELVGQTGGTAIQTALVTGTPGTLTIQPEGTATNKRKIVFPCYSDGAVGSWPYADVHSITCGFTGAGNILANFTDGVN